MFHFPTREKKRGIHKNDDKKEENRRTNIERMQIKARKIKKETERKNKRYAQEWREREVKTVTAAEVTTEGSHLEFFLLAFVAYFRSTFLFIPLEQHL